MFWFDAVQKHCEFFLYEGIVLGRSASAVKVDEVITNCVSSRHFPLGISDPLGGWPSIRDQTRLFVIGTWRHCTRSFLRLLPCGRNGCVPNLIKASRHALSFEHAYCWVGMGISSNTMMATRSIDLVVVSAYQGRDRIFREGVTIPVNGFLRTDCPPLQTIFITTRSKGWYCTSPLEMSFLPAPKSIFS